MEHLLWERNRVHQSGVGEGRMCTLEVDFWRFSTADFIEGVPVYDGGNLIENRLVAEKTSWHLIVFMPC